MDSDSSEKKPRKNYSDICKTPISHFVVSSHAERTVSPHPYEPGTTVGNRYKIDREIGVGGMCTVYLAADAHRDGNPVALKVVTGETNPVRLETFRNEFHVLAHLDHENLIRVFDFGLLGDTGGFYYTAEYVEGKDLGETAPGSDEDTIIDYIVQVCRALEYVHVRGYIHFDVKPKNLLLTREGVVKLADFGITALAGRALGKRIRGTPAYTAPEIITGAAVDARADLYSLGITFYQILTGTRPFPGHNLHKLFHAHIIEPPPPPRSIYADVPEYLEPIVLKLLAKNPVDRFDSANAVIEALAKARGTPIEIQPESSAEGYLRMPPLRGRDAEMEAVRSAFMKLADGNGGHILIEGPSGIGRSRLLQEIHFEAQLQGFATTFENTANPNLFEKLASKVTVQGDTEPAPVPADAEAGAAPSDSKDTAAGNTLPDELADIIAAAEKAPVVIGIDDVQKAPQPVLAALGRLARMLSTSDAPPLLVITSWQDTDGKEPVVTGDTNRLRLRPLTGEETGDVATRMFGRVPAPDLFVKRLQEATGGIPHAVVETLRMLVASGEIALLEGKWRFRGGAEPFPIAASLEKFYHD